MTAINKFVAAAGEYSTKRVRPLTWLKWNVLSPFALPIRGILSTKRLNQAVEAFKKVNLKDEAQLAKALQVLEVIRDTDPVAYKKIMGRIGELAPQFEAEKTRLQVKYRSDKTVSGDTMQHNWFRKGKGVFLGEQTISERSGK